MASLLLPWMAVALGLVRARDAASLGRVEGRLGDADGAGQLSGLVDAADRRWAGEAGLKRAERAGLVDGGLALFAS
ncbi:hypothetical protein GA0070616_0147 [Micromonospora nigra]|uniref:Uncharacterized protein n=1 Tax=Micromonospora nigra TaxID=145857 RepID=A0A1C6R7K2_9ACTN|nr:hypothetical protein GA0070616_0041 [Micromonospora nigra]SCL13166.1 hypothetical protein GA0070616_0147 [Micromonospora nigra]